MKKDKEIRDRLAKIFNERAEKKVTDKEFQKFYDGALLVFGECAKKLWPSFNLMPLESACSMTLMMKERDIRIRLLLPWAVFP